MSDSTSKIHSILHRIKEPNRTVSITTEHAREIVEQVKGCVLTSGATDDTIRTSIGSFVSSGEFSSFLQWIWRLDVINSISNWTLEELTDSFFIWFAAPFHASTAWMSLTTTAASSNANDLLAPVLQRFVDQQRLMEVIKEVCDTEMTKKKNTTHNATISPQTQAIIDSLCTMPDLLSNALQTRVPYALSQSAWFTALSQQVSAFLHQVVLAPTKHDAAYFKPIGHLLTKASRLGRREEMLDGLLTPLKMHVEQHLSIQTSITSSSTKQFRPYIATLATPLLIAHAAAFQAIGVQGLEQMVVSTIQWIGRGLTKGDLNGTDSLRTRTLLTIMPSLFPLSFFSSSSFFSTLITKKLLTSRTATLSPPAVKVLVEYIATISHDQLYAQGDPDEREAIMRRFDTLLDSVLLDALKAWAGEESSSASSSATSSRIATATPSETQLHLGRIILCALEKIEQMQPGFDPTKAALPKEKRQPKQKTNPVSDPTSTDTGVDDDDLKSLGSFAQSPCVPYVLSGVQVRLSSPLLNVRRNAMQIAKVFSRLLGGSENELDFEGEDTEDAVGEYSLDDEDSKSLIPSGSDPSTPKVTVTLNPANMINPAHLRGTSASNSPLKPMPMHDDEKDLRKVPLPVFLRPALEMLQKNSDSVDHISSALAVLPTLIRKNPADLPLLSTQIMSSLLTMGSNNLLEVHPELGRQRRQAIVAMCTSSNQPVLQSSVAYLVQEFYSSNHALATKVEILEMLRQAAEELSDMQEDAHGAVTSRPKQALPGSEKKSLISEVPSASSASASSLVPINQPKYYSSSSSASDVSQTLQHHQEIIRARVEQRTRRWGSLARKGEQGGAAAPVKTYSVNRFTPVAHLFFYPLMKQIDQPGALYLLQQHDSLLLIRLLHTVSAFLPCSSGLAQTLPLVTRAMAKVLMEYLLMHASRIQGAAHSTGGESSSEQIGIRRMLFFALSRILVTYNEKLFADDFPGELPELVSWLTDSVQNDRDAECRQLAHANLYFLKQLLGNPFEQIFKQQENQASSMASLASAQLPPLKF